MIRKLDSFRKLKFYITLEDLINVHKLEMIKATFPYNRLVAFAGG